MDERVSSADCSSRRRRCATPSNGEEFLRRGASTIVGVPVSVLDGDEEAALSYVGATKDLAPRGPPTMIVDVGGGLDRTGGRRSTALS
jgi:hypothetical protein